jgi:hypothetical protein
VAELVGLQDVEHVLFLCLLVGAHCELVVHVVLQLLD